MSLQALREFTNRQAFAGASLAAIAAILDARLDGPPLDPIVAARIAELLGAAGAPPDLLDRIELRAQGVEQLADQRAFDLAWLPTMFVPDRAVAPGCARLLTALKPGGWVLVNALKPGIDAQTAALWRLRTTMFGNANV